MFTYYTRKEYRVQIGALRTVGRDRRARRGQQHIESGKQDSGENVL
jgi:hypothetical protein